MSTSSGRWVVALTGASGMRYGLELLRELSIHPDIKTIQVIVSEAGLRVLNDEEGLKFSSSTINARALFGEELPKLEFFPARDIGAPCASGSFVCEGMVIAPCSMATLGAIANGVPQNLIHRAAEVAMKEGRKLILSPRETPLSAIHLENMLKLARLGVAIVPAMPGFYHKPSSIADLVKMQVMKLMDSMGLENDLAVRWK